MACCDPKQGAGKCLVFFFTIAFGLGVTISTLSPNWIAFAATDKENNSQSHQVEWGPFYGQYRTCSESVNQDGTTRLFCDEWTSNAVDLSDCESIEESDDLAKLCRHLATFRSTGIICLILVLIGGGLVFAASCCQMVTCGCCGNSLTCISNVLFSLEVLLSIVTWSFAISSLRIIKTGPQVTNSEYQWAFWLFIATGTIVGALAAWMADWAAEDSCLRGIWHCVTCRSCRKGGDDDDRGAPLMGDSSA